jgi:N-acetylneuraminate synthase/sialic acid synthase
LQKRDNRSLFTRELYDSPYNNDNSYGDTYGAHREALELGRDAYVELQRYAAELGILLFATAFDHASADLLASLDLPLYKIASSDLKNIHLQKHVASFGKPMIVSTGGGTMDDVKRVYDTVMPINPQLCLMQCTAIYPAEPQDLNLRVIQTFRDEFPDVVIGLSDHQNGIAMSVVAYVLGAQIIEKHFTLNRAWRGSDHPFSLEPIGMKKLVRDLRRARLAMGDGVKRALPGEARQLYKTGKKLVAASDLPEGHTLSPADIAIKSPNDGLPPYELERLVGRVTRRALRADETLSFDNLT